MESHIAAQVESLLEVKRFDDAIKEALKGLASFPDSFYLHSLLLRAHLDNSHFQEAGRVAEALIRQAPDQAYAYFLGSIAMHHCKRFTSELQMAETSCSLEPENPTYLYRLAEAQLQNGLIKKARATCEQVVKLQPDDAESHELTGRIDLELDQYPSAERHFRAALAIEPDDIGTLNNLAIALSAQKKYRDAIDILFTALKNQPDNTNLQHNCFEFIKIYLDNNTLSGKRDNALNQLPTPIKMFYLDYKKRVHPLRKYSHYTMYLFWALFLLVLAGVMQWASK